MVILAIVLGSCESSESRIDYFDLEIPNDVPEIFAPELISLQERWEGNANFSPDGTEFYFNVFSDSMKTKKIYWSKKDNGKWQEPKELSEIGGFDNWEPFLSYSGDELYFVSSRRPGTPDWNGRIWRANRNLNKGWDAPYLMDWGIETDNGLWFPNTSRINTEIIYFGGNLEEHAASGMGDLYFIDLSTREITNLQPLNSSAEDWDPFIAPDESFILWASDREGGFGGTDLYISFKKEGGGWDKPMNMGDKINSPDYEVAPRISSDGKVLFFDRPKNGEQDIYWISSDVIETLNTDQ